MPWIHVTSTSAAAGGPSALAADLCAGVAAAAGLVPSDVVVLVDVADGSAGSGALVTVAGRRRDDATEREVVDTVRRIVARGTDLAPDLVAVVRT